MTFDESDHVVFDGGEIADVHGERIHGEAPSVSESVERPSAFCWKWAVICFELFSCC
jgi:hypothetical protein